MEAVTPHATVLHVVSNPSSLVNENIQYSLRVLTDTFVKTIICFIGVGTNIINIIVFTQIGLRDSVTVAFFGLAFADFGFVFFTLIYQVLESLDLFVGLQPEISLKHLSYFVNYIAFIFVDISILITLFTSLQKCACVAIPFLFKKIFTYHLSKVVVSTMYVIVILYYIPLLVTSVLVPRFDRTTNRTRYMLPSDRLRDRVLDVFEIVNRVLLPFASIVLLTVSLLIMNRKLVEASRIRQAMTNKTNSAPKRGNTVHENSYLSSNELKVIKAVVMLSAIFVACNLPDMVSFLTSLVIPDFGNSGKFNNSYRLVRAVQNVLAVINSTATIFVYVKYNTKYRARFLILLARFWCQADRN
ncbi:unnamed protein product [Candidula unifasciata]|uniref:G-protein coupled receptors family 1 profile domain-containing protein n=1 Tax=Candidula unifasciata TaxID=100452 RepID=A0A8S3YPP3_9EUPU|nr:unnamed protein product [Candidula unifasciata]